MAVQLASVAILKAALGYQVVAATTAVAPAFTTGTAPTTSVLGTASFRRPPRQQPTARARRQVQARWLAPGKAPRVRPALRPPQSRLRAVADARRVLPALSPRRFRWQGPRKASPRAQARRRLGESRRRQA